MEFNEVQLHKIEELNGILYSLIEPHA